MNKNNKNWIYFIAGMLFVILILSIIYFYYSDPKGFEETLLEFINSFGYLGLFLVAIIANASILLPLPLDFFVLILAGLSKSIIDVLLIGLVCGIGSAVGEMSAYIIGLMGVKSAEKFIKKETDKLDEIERRLRSSGMIFIFLGAFTPFPFDLIGIAAGIIKFDPKRFFVAAALGKILRYELLALAGFYGIELIKTILMMG
ncbi:MAG: DedA family protein [Candidatus Diapherotrites archaeon]|nr:DedA family protein [Candidatus Diapherotrites archaeon]